MPKAEPTSTDRIYQRIVSRQDAENAYKNLAPMRDGRNNLVRFNVNARLEHLVLMGIFGMMALSGLAQTFENTSIGGFFLLILGGVSGAQKIHHLFAILLGAFALYHVLRVFDGYFLHRQAGSILPDGDDIKNIFQMLRLALGFTKKVPLYGRYTGDQKFLYWITALCVGLAVVTGLIIWVPAWITTFVPGSIYPYAVLLHRWQAILIVLVVVILHGYQVILSRRDFSIFTGRISLEQMTREHPLELAYLEQAAALHGEEKFPQAVRFSIEEGLLKSTVTLTEEGLTQSDNKKSQPQAQDAIQPSATTAPDKAQAPVTGQPTQETIPATGETAK